MKTKPEQVKVPWVGGRQGKGYITDFKPARKNARYPGIGSALYVALCKDGSIAWSERRPLHINHAINKGLVKP